MRDPLYKDDFEWFLTKEAEQHRMYASDRVWRNIQDTLHGKDRWPALTFIFLFIIALLCVGTLLVKPEEHLNFIHKTPYLMAGPVADTVAPDTSVVKFSERLATGTTTEQTIAYANERLLRHQVNTTIAAMPATDSVVSRMHTVIVASLPASSPASLLPIYSNTPAWTALDATTIPLAATPSEAALAIVAVPLYEVTPPPAPEVAPAAVVPEAATTTAAAPDLVMLPRSTGRNRWSFQLYITPSASYRRLVEPRSSKGLAQYLSTPLAPNYLVDVNSVVRHTPASGIEAGMSFGYHLNGQFSVRAGLQYNVRQYNIEASGYSYEATTIVLNGQESITTYTPYRNIQGDYPITLHNKYHELSIPVGIQWTGWTHRKLAWGVSATLQPTYTFDKQPFIISTDFKNYANGAGLTRRWNLNTSFETYLSYTIGDFQWQIGPQFRYQQFSSFKKEYPIKEYLLDYGIKIGFTTPL